MPRQGNGTYTLPANTWFPGVNGVTATTADWNATATDIQAALTQSVSSDGQTALTGNLPMGNNKITGLATGTANTDAASVANIQAKVGQDGAASFRNLLINAGGWINQRAYASGNPTGIANQYTLDRWRVVTLGQTLTFTAAAPDFTMTAPAGGLEQVIEGANIFGGIYTLSWTGTATATVNGVSITNGGNTASLAANSNVTVRFSNGTVLRPQFEIGTTATPFERRLIGLELLLCQRYFEIFPVGALDFIGNNTNAGQNNTYTVPMKMTKRAAPVFVSNWAGVNVGAITASILTASNVTLNAPNTAAGQWRITSNSASSIDSEL